MYCNSYQWNQRHCRLTVGTLSARRVTSLQDSKQALGRDCCCEFGQCVRHENIECTIVSIQFSLLNVYEVELIRCFWETYSRVLP